MRDRIEHAEFVEMAESRKFITAPKKRHIRIQKVFLRPLNLHNIIIMQRRVAHLEILSVPRFRFHSISQNENENKFLNFQSIPKTFIELKYLPLD